MKKIICFIFLSIGFQSKAQTGTAIYVDYFNADRNQLKSRLEVFKKFEKTLVFVGSGYGLVNYLNEIKGLLDYHISINSDNSNFRLWSE